jgi:methyl-accepting chemotaxis protein
VGCNASSAAHTASSWVQGGPALTERIATTLERAIGQRYEVTANAVAGRPGRLVIHLTLIDGSPLTIDMHPATFPLSEWLPVVLVAQCLLIIVCTWYAVRLATRPLTALADAADSMGPDLTMNTLEVRGCDEIARAARAFNAMQKRINEYMAERVQMPAALQRAGAMFWLRLKKLVGSYLALSCASLA